jgi:hypothetical protein
MIRVVRDPHDQKFLDPAGFRRWLEDGSLI